ncbi:hypothetical protein BDY19DRAFT_983760 [Irpex rosettiformis]|uniref:Uncharacterized protein n=1 Tax=Irpex rosettiformis TaxID=378272 RepID=A0ACB8UBN7_9APHY|nr:hypothetical protein BDY19DRAFT_983760 [Irpex rosettiformis]
MSQLTFKKAGLFAIHDTGKPPGVEHYTTLFIVHGFAWHGAVFARMIPFANTHKTRLVLVNRRDYPGAVPYTASERAALHASQNPDTTPAGALTTLLSYAQTRALEFHDFLRSFAIEEELSEKTVILAYPPYHALGYPPPPTFYNPLTDPSHPPGTGIQLFPAWVSGYYTHGDSPHELEHRTPLQDPPPTILTMTHEEIEGAVFPGPGEVGGSDEVFLHSGVRCGLWEVLRGRALFVGMNDDDEEKEDNVKGWNDIELRYVWCDRSVWELPWATWALQAELAEAEKAGREVRKVRLVRLRGANHFVHWDEPERALKALLADSSEEEEEE